MYLTEAAREMIAELSEGIDVEPDPDFEGLIGFWDAEWDDFDGE